MDRGAWWATVSMRSQRVRHDRVSNTHFFLLQQISGIF